MTVSIVVRVAAESPSSSLAVKEIVKFETGQDLEFSVAMELIPDITPVDFKTLKLERTVVDVPETEIEESLQRLAKRQRKPEPAADDHAAQSGDVVVIDFVGRVDGKEFEGGKAEDFHLELGSGMFIPGFEAGIIATFVSQISSSRLILIEPHFISR